MKKISSLGLALLLGFASFGHLNNAVFAQTEDAQEQVLEEEQDVIEEEIETKEESNVADVFSING